MGTKLDTPWLAVAALAARQHGVVARRQLAGLGVTPRGINRAAARGHLHRLYRGVYAVGHNRISPYGRFLAAALACGRDAALSYRSAGQLWGLGFDYWKIEVTARGGPEGVLVHRTRRIPPLTIVNDIPVTTLGRTLVDLADVVTARRLQRAFDDAERLRLLDIADVHAIPGRPGEKNIRALLAEYRRPAATKSEFERLFGQFLREERLPWPLFNTLVEGVEVDAFWPRARLVGEMDSWEHHGKSRMPFEEDRDKDIRLQLAGYRVVRITWRKLHSDRRQLAAQLRAFLDHPAAAA